MNFTKFRSRNPDATPHFTARDFNFIASNLMLSLNAANVNREGAKRAILVWSKKLEATNPTFDANRFAKYCWQLFEGES